MRLGVPGAKSEITYLVITNCPTRYILWFGLRKLGTGLGMVRRRPCRRMQRRVVKTGGSVSERREGRLGL
jgi:hypothetical protein